MRSGLLQRLLAQFFVRTVATRYGLASPTLTPEFIAALRAHTWPGNVRELRHAIERALLLSPSGELDVRELAVEDSSPTLSGTHGIPFPATMAEISRSAALAALQMQRGNKSAAARMLNVSRGRLDRLIEPGGVEDNVD